MKLSNSFDYMRKILRYLCFLKFSNLSLIYSSIMIALVGINYAARGANQRCLSFSLANFENIAALDVTAAFNERLPENSSLSSTTSLLARGSRSEGDGANAVAMEGA